MTISHQRGSRATKVAIALALLGAIAAPSPSVLAHTAAPAEDDADADARARARAFVEQGARLYDEGKYDEALVAFQDAAASYGSPDFQFNIGLCHERLGHYDAAIAAFEVYLRNKPDASDRVGVEHRLELLRNLAKPPTDRTPPTVRTPPPTVVGRPDVARPRSDIRPQTDTGGARAGRGLTAAGGTLVATGVLVGVAGGVGFGVLAADRTRKVRDVVDRDNPSGLSLANTETLAREGDRYRALQLASLGVGVAIVGAGVALLVTGRRRARNIGTANVAAGRGFAIVGLRGEF